MKQRIKEQSILLFEKKGFTETSIQDIVDALGVTKGTFYYYFSSKEQLLMDIHLHYIDDLLQHQLEILVDNKKSCKEKLKDVVLLLITDIKEQGPSARVFLRELRNLTNEHLQKILTKRDKFRLNIEQLLADGVAKEEFRKDLEIDIITFGILGVTNWTYQWFDPAGTKSDHDVAEIYIDMILRGIQKE
ncbi:MULTISPECIES: TetR/AcrR family transcriptional regulator [Bacillaceae]|uniref:TetR/AcrR family transcriptional regulator n=1 Tax=Bacillaceae TaxID=186817 RepID=UPI001BDED159|nr:MULTISPECIES: TetR/AcrR family transcriptional regulator [Bacillaceae]MDX8360222.1 TetR/AcrR family transcriptional regulator [Cytobacillus sp. IB215316]